MSGNNSDDILSQADEQSVEVPYKQSDHSEHIQQKDDAPYRKDTDDDKKDKAIDAEVELRTTAEEERLTGKRLH